MRAILLVMAVALLGAGIGRSEAQPPAVTVYHEDPAHLWNRVHRALLVRPGLERDQLLGLDSLDPILWANTKHLLEGASHRQAIDVLDEFIAQDGERLIDDPVKRAILQRDLWAIFDWACVPRHAYESEQRALRERLAAVIARVALIADEVAALPDTYAAAVKAKRFAAEADTGNPSSSFLPADLFDETGPWINVAAPGDLVAPGHARVFSRSVFEVFFRHPDGRQAGKDYLNALSNVPEPFVVAPDPPHGQRLLPRLNPDLPQFPQGTQVALVRRAMLLDTSGQIVPTRLIESVQLRVYLRVPARGEPRRREDQSFHEFVLTRRGLFQHPSRALRAIEPDEQDVLFVNLASHGIDWIESPPNRPDEVRRLTHPVLASCFSCHGDAGVYSLNSFTRFMGPRTFTPALYEASGDTQERAAVGSKRARYDWGVLEQLMRHPVRER